jgi:hypothetical protein
VEACRWYLLAAAHGHKRAVESVDRLSTVLTPDQLAEARRRAAAPQAAAGAKP